MVELDVRGLSCPEPVMMVKSELDKKNDEFKVLVSEKHVVRNITNIVETYGRKVEVTESNEDYLVIVK